MAKAPTTAAETTAAAPEPQYFEVTLNRLIEVRGHRYRPGQHIVDETTLAEMGDAVASKRPVAN